MSKIPWTDDSWNPVTGCTKTSDGCKNCYAERMAKRLKAMGQPNYRNGFEVTCHEHMLDKPLTWKKPRMIFVCSMGDLFHPDVPFIFIDRVMDTIRAAHWHTFQVLTKRSERMAEYFETRPVPENLWCGTSMEKIEYLHRAWEVSWVNAPVTFLSIEPLLGPIDLGEDTLKKIDWVIVGCESGPNARPMELDWVREIRDQCVKAKVPFFFKQAMEMGKIVKLPELKLDGRVWDEMPNVPRGTN